MTTDVRPSAVAAYLAAQAALDASREQLASLASDPGVATFQAQIEVLKRQLAADPGQFRDLFIRDGVEQIAAGFAEDALTAEFTTKLWEVLLRDDDATRIVRRFLWDAPLRLKRKFVAGLDAHLSGRYPMFAGLSRNWPAGNNIGPYIRPAAERARDFDLVNTGYLGYRELGYTQREVDTFVWLEALRDKQCSDSPCELGELLASGTRKGGCPVQIHIPSLLDLLGQGKFAEALALLEACNPLPNVTGRVCPQELQCQGVCSHQQRPIEIGQLEWFLPQREKKVTPEEIARRYGGRPDPWTTGTKPPIAIVGSGPAGLINAFLLAADGFPVTVFEAFHELGGVLRYGIPEFRLPNELIDDVVGKIRLLGGRFVTNFVVGKTATLDDLREAGFARIFVGTGAGLPQFMNVPGEHLLNVMSANEFLTRVNLMRGASPDFETPLPEVAGKKVLVIGGGNTAMDAARTSLRLGGDVTIVYRRDQASMPCRIEELHHALEEGVKLQTLTAPCEFVGGDDHKVAVAICDVMRLGDPDASGRRSPVPTGARTTLAADLVIMALGNASNPIIRDSQPDLATTPRGAIKVGAELAASQETSLAGVYSGGDAARGGSTAIRAAGDGQSAAREMAALAASLPAAEIRDRVHRAKRYTNLAATQPRIVAKTPLAPGIVEFEIYAPVIARSARAGQFVRVLGWPNGELIPLTLADWDADAGTITLVIQAMGTSSTKLNRMSVGQTLAGIAGPLGLPSAIHSYGPDQTVAFTAGGVGLPAVFPIARAHLEAGNHVTLIVGFRSESLLFWNGEAARLQTLKKRFGDQVDIVFTSDDGTFGLPGLVTVPLRELLDADVARAAGQAPDAAPEGPDDPHHPDLSRRVAEVVTVGPPRMMEAVCNLTRGYGTKTVASLNSIMVDATGMCGACMVPVHEGGRLVRKHACIDGPELDGHAIDWEKFLPRFGQFRAQERASRERAGL